MSSEKVNILIVDDQPAKLLSLETILAELGENVLKAGTADEALRALLAHDVAIVLVDVCMPHMDGFELAELIRGHPRCQQTAIIFISAVHLTDADRLRGYNLGAVDYIPVPLIPQVLRAKVAIFAELFRKREQLERLNLNLEQRVAERTAALESSNARLRESERRYRELVQGLPAAVFTCDTQGRITLYNQAAIDLWGRVPDVETDRWTGAGRMYRTDGSLMTPDDSPTKSVVRDGVSPPAADIIIERPDGSRRYVLPHPEPIRDGDGRVVGAVNMLLDTTEQRAAQQVLSRDRETLERLIAERTAQLEQSNEQLRISDRMAVIGTLCAGLGHDIANLLLPVRMRLDSIEGCDLSAAALADVDAIRKACDYLRRLASSLRLLALDPERQDPRNASTNLGTWWEEAEGMIRNGVLRPATLAAQFDEELPSLSIGRAALTQIVFNLVQNAGDALRGRENGVVMLKASRATPGSVRISVIDNGPGMDAETRRRCLEPFFTTKTRGLGTGLGLALVSGLVKGAGGGLEVESSPGRGTAFHLEIPVAGVVLPEGSLLRTRRCAVVTVGAPRLRAFMTAVLKELSIDIADGGTDAGAARSADVWITDSLDGVSTEARASRPGSRIILFSDTVPPPESGAYWIHSETKLSLLGEQVRSVLMHAESGVRA